MTLIRFLMSAMVEVLEINTAQREMGCFHQLGHGESLAAGQEFLHGLKGVAVRDDPLNGGFTKLARNRRSPDESSILRSRQFRVTTRLPASVCQGDSLTHSQKPTPRLLERHVPGGSSAHTYSTC